MSKKEKLRVILRSALLFSLIFLIITGLLAFYGLRKERAEGVEALNQKEKIISMALSRWEDQDWQMFLTRIDDSCRSTLDGNSKNQFYYYRIWDNRGQLLTESADLMRTASPDGTEFDIVFNLGEYLTKEQLEFCLKAISQEEGGDKPPGCRLLCRLGEVGGRTVPAAFYLEKLDWEASPAKPRQDPYLGGYCTWRGAQGAESYVRTGGKIVFEWKNPRACLKIHSRHLTKSNFQTRTRAEGGKGRFIECTKSNLLIPYYQDGFRSWQFWKTADWPLADGEVLGEKTRSGAYKVEEKTDIEGIFEMKAARLRGVDGRGRVYVLEICAVRRSFQNVWDSMGMIWLILLGTMVLCCVIVIREQVGIYEKRKSMEQDRVDFINGCAHELKTPLAVIRMCSESLREKELEFQKGYYLDTMEQKTREMDGLIRQMILLSQMNSIYFTLNKKPCEIGHLLEREMEKLAPVIQEKKLHIIKPDRQEYWEVDEKYFSQLLFNICSNAASYTPTSGTIRIILEGQRLCIENEGEPIEKELLGEIFQMFRSQEGHLGFGLYLAQRIAGLHGMECVMENTPGGNCCTVERGKTGCRR